jgi:hypothetical protein
VDPVLGSDEQREPFVDAAGDAFPRMGNFSFDDRNARWTVLDASSMVDWSNSALQDCVAIDLAAAKGASWRFVSSHQPG